MAMVLGASNGCDETGPPRQRVIPREAGWVAFIGAGPQDLLWPRLQAGAQRFERSYGLIQVRYAVPSTPTAQAQRALLQGPSTPPLRGICIHPVEPEALAADVLRARRDGVRVVTILRRIPGIPSDGHVGIDETAVGRALAQATVEGLGGKGTIMILHAGQSDPDLRTRYEAFRAAIETRNAIRIWADIDFAKDCSGRPAEARRQIAERSSRFPSLTAWVCIAPWPLLDPPAEGPVLPSGIRVITVGAEPWMWPHIEAGTCPAVVGFDYSDAGFKALQFCQGAIMAVDTGLREYHLPVRIVTRDRLEAYQRDWLSWLAPSSPADTSRPAKVP